MVNMIDTFKKGLLPGNYFLTKSMEISKNSMSGTLWYTKKFLVYYYYIFLTEEIKTLAWKKPVIKIFDEYIESLPIELHAEAKKFFYSDESLANLKSKKFKSFSQFKGNSDFESESEEKLFDGMAKKYYFAFLMGSGGQSGLKAYIKDSIYKPSFDMTKIDDLIKKYYSDRKINTYNLTQQKNDYMAFLRNERQVTFPHLLDRLKVEGFCC